MTAPTLRPQTGRRPAAAAASLWPTVAAMIGSAALAVIVLVLALVRTSTGAQLDHDMEWALGGPPWLFHNIEERLLQVSVTTLGLSTLIVIGIAVLRRRLALAIGIGVLVAGANVSTKVLKEHLIHALPGAVNGNSMPSGHATVGASLTLAVLLALPAAWHRITVPLTCGVGFFFCAGTVVGHWHRPGDALAALAVCLGWTGVALAVTAVAEDLLGTRAAAAELPAREGGPTSSAPLTWQVLAGLCAAAIALVSFLFLAWGAQPSTPGGRDLVLGLTAVIAVAVAAMAVYTWVARTAAAHLR